MPSKTNTAPVESFPDIDQMVDRARAAMSQLEDVSQARIDGIVKALAWAIYRYDNALTLAEMAVEDTGLGNVADKVTKNRRKTFGTLCDLMAEQTRGLCHSDDAKGLYTYLKPVGVVGSLTPSTNPAATPANQALMALKGGNAIIISPSPTGHRTAHTLKSYFDRALSDIGESPDLFQVVNHPISLKKAFYLCQAVDLIIVTGDQANVRLGYTSGTPCIGVGKGNVSVIVDSSADLTAAAEKIAASKTFDNATSCSSENAVIILDDVYDDMMVALQAQGGYLSTRSEQDTIEKTLFAGGKINRHAVGKGMDVLGDLFELDGDTKDRKFILVTETDAGSHVPLSGEKLSLVLTVYRAKSFDDAVRICSEILHYEGLGHSVGIHTKDPDMPHKLAQRIKVARVLVNQAHTFGNGGGLNNGLPFTLTMGGGTWAGNSICENLSIKHFVNKTVLTKTFDKPQQQASTVFGDVYDPALDD